MMSDRFYRATQALKILPKYYEGKPTYDTSLSEEKKQQILDLLSQRIKKAEIARRVEVAASTVYNFERRYLRAIEANR